MWALSRPYSSTIEVFGKLLSKLNTSTGFIDVLSKLPLFWTYQVRTKPIERRTPAGTNSKCTHIQATVFAGLIDALLGSVATMIIQFLMK